MIRRPEDIVKVKVITVTGCVTCPFLTDRYTLSFCKLAKSYIDDNKFASHRSPKDCPLKDSNTIVKMDN